MVAKIFIPRNEKEGIKKLPFIAQRRLLTLLQTEQTQIMQL